MLVIHITSLVARDGNGSLPATPGPGGSRDPGEKMKHALFHVKPSSYGWIAYAEGRPEDQQFFVSKSLALTYAQLWAEANRPSKLQLLDKHGAVDREWSYDALMV
jgi:hypothetical protein